MKASGAIRLDWWLLCSEGGNQYCLEINGGKHRNGSLWLTKAEAADLYKRLRRSRVVGRRSAKARRRP